jgi:hypothetical protein
MFAIIILQQNIMLSLEYKDFVTDKLPLLIQVSKYKAEAKAFLYNNLKRIKIRKIQDGKRTIIQKMALVRKQLIEWNEMFFKDEVLKETPIERQERMKLTFDKYTTKPPGRTFEEEKSKQEDEEDISAFDDAPRPLRAPEDLKDEK